jgi:hypothetical protein
MTAPAQFAANEDVHGLNDRYPWNDEALNVLWQKELDLLREGAHTASDKAMTDAEVAELVRAFLDQRKARRSNGALSPILVDYEQKREWIEGLAKYSELRIGLQAYRAGEEGTYEPVPGLTNDPKFKAYRTQARYWNAQINELKRMTQREEIRFYHTGMAQAVMLDRLMPDWKDRIWEDGVWLEDLLAEAVSAD